VTDIAGLIVTAGAALFGAAIPITGNYASERGRNRGIREVRNHDKRTDVAQRYLEKLSDFRRATWALARARPDAYEAEHEKVVDAARDVADLSARLRLWFERPVVDAEEKTRECVVRMQKHAEAIQADEPSQAWETIPSLDDDQKNAHVGLVD
jgi:hypothetical protein